jgi:hypothetical protein
MKSVQIPTHWSGEQALSMVAFLDELIRSIWSRHGEEMAEVLRRDRAPTPSTDPGPAQEVLPF